MKTEVVSENSKHKEFSVIYIHKSYLTETKV